MTLNFTSAREIIGRLEHDLTVDFSDWIARAPLWIADGLAEMNSMNTLEDASETITIENHRGSLPCDAKYLIACDYLGHRMNCITKVHSPYYELTSLFVSEQTYELYSGGQIMTSFDNGEVLVLYKRPPVEYWQEHNIYLPKVPDDQFVKESLKWFLMMRILQKGHKHPLYNLRDQNAYTNPALQWEIYKKKAVNSMGTLSSDEREELSKLLRTFLNDRNYHNDTNYKPQ